MATLTGFEPNPEFPKLPGNGIGEAPTPHGLSEACKRLGKQAGFKVEYGMGYSDTPDIEMGIKAGDKFGLTLASLLRTVHAVKMTERPINPSEPDTEGVSIYLPPP